jgi:orotidine-5'-phosphate decarboxylase
VGLELFSAAGPDAVGSLRDLGMSGVPRPQAVRHPEHGGRSTRVLGALGVDYLTLHALGGVDMLKAGVEGLHEGAEAAGLESPVALAVTVLTSDDTAPAHIVPNRVRAALEGGCGGLVLAATDLADRPRARPGPAPRRARHPPGGIARARPGALGNAPEQPSADGADLLVIGRAVTAADDPAASAAGIAASVARQLTP